MSMEIGQIVDFIEEHNRIHDTDDKRREREPDTVREASQADIDALMG